MPSVCSNTRQLVSSACTCTAWALRSTIADSSGTSSSAVDFSAPHTVPWATRSPSAAKARTIRCTGSPSTYFSYSSLAKNDGVNRPLGIGFGAGGAITVRWPGQSHRRRYRNRRCTTRVIVTCQSTCSLVSEPKNSNSSPQQAHTRASAGTSWISSRVSRCE